MKVLNTGSLSQNILIIPREYDTGVLLRLRNESTNTITLYYVTAEVSNDYLSIDNIYSLIENNFYTIDIYGFQDYRDFKARVLSDGGTFVDSGCLVQYYYQYSDSDVIYKDKIFCTDQNVNQSDNEYYNINENEYTEHSSNNDYIII